jgi:ABC-type multidrug transport system fused ATPase/permease subunit
LGEDGFNLSGGQRQKLAIARVLLNNPPYYIFDEATSALDNHSEKQIQNIMEKELKNKTAFIIAHRLSTIQFVDRILVFDRGNIIQDGSFEALSKKPGMFKYLLDSQFSLSRN